MCRTEFGSIGRISVGYAVATTERYYTWQIKRIIFNTGNTKSGLSPINLPTGSTIDGGEHTIKGVRLGGALFGDATNLTVCGKV